MKKDPVEKSKLILSKKVIEYIINQDMPEENIITIINEVARLGTCQATSHLLVFRLGGLYERMGGFL